MDLESRNQHPLRWKLVAYIVMVGFMALTIGPLIWLGYSSFKPHAEIVRNIFSLPSLSYPLLPEPEEQGRAGTNTNRSVFNRPFYLVQNYVTAWTRGSLAICAFNSVLYSVVTTVISTILALTTGYGLAKFGYKISGPIYVFFMMGLLLTVHSILVPLFVMETKLGIANTRLGVILPYIAFGLPFLVFLGTSFVKGLPAELEEAAIIDGASYLDVFWHVILPVSQPVVATMAIFRFLGAWNEFAMVFILTSETAIRTLPVGINAFAGGLTRDYGTQFAALMIGTLPMIIFYIFFNKQIQEGFASGALKE